MHVLDSEALSLVIRGDRVFATRIATAELNDVKVVTSPMTVVEAYDHRTSEKRLEWTLLHVDVPHLDVAQAREAITLLKAAGLHGHKYAIDAVLAAMAQRQVGGKITVFTSDTDDLEQLLPSGIAVEKV